MWWGFRYVLYLFATVFVLNIVIQLIVGNAPPAKVRKIKTAMKTAEGFTTAAAATIPPQKEIFGDWFGLETFGFKWTAMVNIFSSLLIYLDYFTQKTLRGIYADFVVPLLRI